MRLLGYLCAWCVVLCFVSAVLCLEQRALRPTIPRAMVCVSRVFVAFVCAACSAWGAPSISVEYEAPSSVAGVSGGAFASRVLALAARVARGRGEVDDLAVRAAKLSGEQPGFRVASSAFLASRLIPVDAAGVRKGLAVTEPMASASDSVNVVMREDVGAVAGRASQHVAAAQLAQLQADFEQGLANLNGGQ